jgi:hypothetical protein
VRLLIDTLAPLLDSPIDLQIIWMWMAGHVQVSIASTIGMSQEAVAYRLTRLAQKSPLLTLIVKSSWRRPSGESSSQMPRLTASDASRLKAAGDIFRRSHPSIWRQFGRICHRRGKGKGAVLAELASQFVNDNLASIEPTTPPKLPDTFTPKEPAIDPEWFAT